MKKGILLAAYGSSNPEGRNGLESFERLCRERFAGIPLRWAFTSPFQRDRLARLKKKSDSVAKGLLRFSFEQFDHVAVQPLQLVPGREYLEMAQSVRGIAAETGLCCSLGKPLLGASQSPAHMASLFAAYGRSVAGEKDNIIFMGHGAKHAAGELFRELGQELCRYPGIFLATMSSRPFIEDVLPRLFTERVWLFPMFSVVGMHALRDMAGNGADSWKSRIEACGHECAPVLRGLLENAAFAACWLDSLSETLASLEDRAME